MARYYLVSSMSEEIVNSSYTGLIFFFSFSIFVDLAIHSAFSKKFLVFFGTLPFLVVVQPRCSTSRVSSTTTASERFKFSFGESGSNHSLFFLTFLEGEVSPRPPLGIFQLDLLTILLVPLRLVYESFHDQDPSLQR